MFITFEGIDGSGKTTQAQLLYKYLQDKKIDCMLGSEPLPFVKDICQQFDLDKRAILLLMEVQRSIDVKQIKNSLNTNKVVLLDRYIDSTYAYQHYGRKISMKKIEWLERFIFGENMIMPDLTFLLDIDPLVAKERLKTRDNLSKTDKENLPFFKRVREGYLEMAMMDNRIHIIKANNNIVEQHKEIIQIINEYGKIKI